MRDFLTCLPEVLDQLAQRAFLHQSTSTGAASWKYSRPPLCFPPNPLAAGAAAGVVELFCTALVLRTGYKQEIIRELTTLVGNQCTPPNYGMRELDKLSRYTL